MSTERVALWPLTLSERWPATRIFWTFLAAHVLIWWLLPALLQHNLPLEVIEQLP